MGPGSLRKGRWTAFGISTRTPFGIAVLGSVLLSFAVVGWQCKANLSPHSASRHDAGSPDAGTAGMTHETIYIDYKYKKIDERRQRSLRQVAIVATLLIVVLGLIAWEGDGSSSASLKQSEGRGAWLPVLPHDK
jgi:hypothetical protein